MTGKMLLKRQKKVLERDKDMILCFEEKDRKEIEATGMTVVEFKREIYKLVKIFSDVWDKVKGVLENVYTGISE